jgi:alginate O-acetyltransferase complex protein AlgI
MAIGMGHVFGFKFRENFDHPYTSKSITEFWRRWHISLGSFFRDYVYIPLGGNRKHRVFNLLITWALTGLWHGASWNFLLWGLYFFLLLAVEKLLWKPLRHIPGIIRLLGTLFLVLMGWTLFYYTDFSRLLTALKVMFGQAGSGLINAQLKTQLINGLPLLLVCIIGSTKLPKIIGEGLGLLCAGKEAGGGKQVVYTLLTFLFCLTILALATISLVGSSYSAFLYYRF